MNNQKELRDNFGNVTFGEATELLVEIIGQIVLLNFIPEKNHKSYKRQLERMYDGYGIYSNFAAAAPDSPQYYFERFFRKVLEDKYKMPRLVMILVDSFTWQYFNALMCTVTFERPKKQTALTLARMSIFNIIKHNLLGDKPFIEDGLTKITKKSIITFLEESYDNIFNDIENEFSEEGKNFIHIFTVT